LKLIEIEESLSAQLGGRSAERPSGDRAVAAPPEPAGAYLRSLTVNGFRLIGKPATLSLQPGPGLTVVVGRNIQDAGPAVILEVSRWPGSVVEVRPCLGPMAQALADAELAGDRGPAVSNTAIEASDSTRLRREVSRAADSSARSCDAC
jgi:hypothetical protein